jgi:hypothetical protein
VPLNKPDWREHDRPAADPRTKKWTEGPKRPEVDKPPTSWVARVVLWTLLAAGLVAAVIYLLPGSQRRIPVVSLVVTDYPVPLPVNAFAREDADRFGDLEDHTFDVTDLSEEKISRDEILTRLSDTWQRLAHRQPAPEAVVFYLSLHGATDSEGRPCVLPPLASATDPATWIPVEELLAQLKPIDKLSTKKLVVLDCQRIEQHWPLGVLDNQFATNLKSAIQRLDDPDLVVLWSSSSDTRAPLAPGLAQSVFGRAVFLGLAGGADRFGGNNNGLVESDELGTFVTRRVNHWAARHREQLPDPEFIAAVPPDGPTKPAPFAITTALRVGDLEPLTLASLSTPTPEVASDRLDRLWSERDKLIAPDNPARVSPLALRDIEARLLWIEQANLAGSAYSARAAEQAAEVERLIETLTNEAAGTPLEPTSLALTSRLATSAPGTLAVASAVLDRREAAVDLVRRARALTEISELPGLVGSLRSGSSTGFKETHWLRLLANNLPAERTFADLARNVRGSIETLELAEQAAAPRDERTQYAAYIGVDEGDARRQTADDALLVATPRQLLDAEQERGRANDAYRQSVRTTNALADALATRDRVYRELPDLALWLLQSPVGRSADDELAAVQTTLIPLAEKLDRLTRLLATPPADGRWEMEEISRQASAVDLDYRTLRDRFDRQAVRLLVEAGQDKQTLRDLENALLVPLASSSVRSQLRAKLTAILSGLDADLRFDDESDTWPQIVRVPSLQDRLQSRGLAHPLLAWVAPDAATAGTWTSLEQQVRNEAAAVPLNIETRLADSEEALLGSADPWGVRSGALQADLLVRRTLGLGPMSLPRDPSVELLRIDWHNLLSWHAMRSARDFWGPSAPGEETADSFFLTAGRTLRESAGRAVPTTTGGRSRLVQQAEQLADSGNRALEDGLAVSVTQPPPITDPDQTDIRYAAAVRQTIGLQPGLVSVFVLNPGNAPIPLEIDGGEVLRTSVALSDPPSDRQMPVALGHRMAEVKSHGSVFHVQSLFRGHRRSATVFPELPGELKEYVVDRPKYGPPQLIVFGRQRQGNIVLMLDCSASMQALTETEGGRRVTRLRAAQNVLENLMRRLADSGQYQVAFYLFGHRMNYRTENRAIIYNKQSGLPELSFQRRYGGPGYQVPPNTWPFNDVEAIQPLVPFSQDHRLALLDRLETIEPHGQTPLYPALISGLSEFDGAREGSANMIVAITDGKDVQFFGGSSGLSSRFGPEKTAQDVARARRNRPVTINLVGFEFEDDTPAVRREFADITGETGKFYLSKNASELARDLNDMLDAGEYQLRLPTGGEPAAQSLGQSLIVPNFAGASNYVIELPTASGTQAATPVRLVGGESLELKVSADRTRLEFDRWQQNLLRLSPAVADPLDPNRRFVIGAHQPEWLGRSLRMVFSIQNADERAFSPTPVEVWTEVTPVLPDGQRGPKYEFYDLVLGDGKSPLRPAPIYTHTVPDWPEEAREAEVRLWCKFDETGSDRTLSVGQALRARQDRPPLDERLNIRYTVLTRRGERAGDPTQVIVSLPPGQAELFAVRPTIHPPADRVGRSFDPETNLEVHTFYYDDIDEQAVENYELRFTRRESLQRAAVHPPEPLVFRIPDRTTTVRGQ